MCEFCGGPGTRCGVCEHFSPYPYHTPVHKMGCTVVRTTDPDGRPIAVTVPGTYYTTGHMAEAVSGGVKTYTRYRDR